MNKAKDVIDTLCQRLENAKIQSDSSNAELGQLRVLGVYLVHSKSFLVTSYLVYQEKIRQYVEGVNKMQLISSSLAQISSVVVKEETRSELELPDKMGD